MMQDGTILTAIDVGTTKVCTIIAKKTGARHPKVLAYSVVPSDGLKKGNVADVAATARAVRASIEEAQRKAGVKVKSAFVGVTGAHVSFQNRRDTLDWAGNSGVITTDDLTRVPQMVSSSSVGYGRKVIHAIPMTYTLDGQNGIKSPLGMHSRNLEVETHVVTGSSPFINKLVDAVQSVGVEVETLVLEPLASSEAVLTPQEREQGAVLVDIGGGTTDVVAFNKGAMHYTSVIPVGGFQFTNDICMMYGASFPDAESVKLKYAHTEPDTVHLREEVSLPVSAANTELKVSRRDICQLTRERAQELVRLINLKLQEAGVHNAPNTRIVLTGGASALPGLRELLQRLVPNRVRLGEPHSNGNVPQELKAPAYATGVGILLWALRYYRPTAAHAAAGNATVINQPAEGLIARIWTQVRKLLHV